MWFKSLCGWVAGTDAIEYFKGLPSDIGVSEELDNEAEWIVDITTQADRQGRCCPLAQLPCVLLVTAVAAVT